MENPMILMIDNYDSFTYNLVQVLQTLDQEVLVKRNDAITVSEIERLSPQAIVLSPGPGRPDSAGCCLEIIRQFSGKYPILGVCLGHQIIAQAFGSKIISTDIITHAKSSFIFHHGQGLYKKMPLPFKAGRYHSLCIEKNSLAQDLQIESETADQVIMGIKHRTHPTFGIQFHPESILTTHGEHLLKNFLEATC
jgi:anthranilate synthase component 2